MARNFSRTGQVTHARDREFWVIQALVVLATVAMLADDFLLGEQVLGGGLHDVPVMLFIAPVMLAAITYGLEGALLTIAVVVLLVAPHSVARNLDNWEWLGDVGTLSVAAVTGIFLATRAERERDHRRRAEDASERLQMLNDLATDLERAREPRELVDRFLAGIGDGMRLTFAWVRYRPAGDAVVTVTYGLPSGAGPAEDVGAATAGATERVRVAREPWVSPEGWHVVPVVADLGFLGAVGVARRLPPIGDADLRAVESAAAQLALMLENVELQRQRRESLQSYARRVTNVQEEERRRIARELHDGPTQDVSGVLRGLDVLRVQAASEGTVPVESMEALRGAAERAVASLRSMTRDLRPTVLDDLGLVPAIEWLTGAFEERTAIPTDLHVGADLPTIGTSQELSAYRVVQEAMSNIEKHAGARHVDVVLEATGSGLRVVVTDDGHGFEMPASFRELAYRESYGLLGMQERASLHGAVLRVDSAPGEGTTVSLTLWPRADDDEPAEHDGNDGNGAFDALPPVSPRTPGEPLQDGAGI